MAFGRSLSSLQLYDVLANLVPGAVILLSLIALFSPGFSYIQGFSFLSAGILAVVSLVAGHVIQYVASQWAGTPHLFGDIIEAVKEDNPGLADARVTHIEQMAWPMMRKRFDLPEGFEDYGALFRLLLSYVESTPASRALRFQALHSLHRSLWATGRLMSLFALISIVIWQFSPSYVRGLEVSISVLAIGLLFTVVFESRKNKFSKKFVQYAIADFYAFETKDS